ncbi:peptidoglycan-binding protein [Nostoc sphaeroides CHAB 2801]|uniref:peptidoglycan-binding domain-containing protein n=1 Tax=Nostoc sphaeroides TaxID=446679 RepID=UPI000E4AC0AD|nr:peptidoglycan-binding domain-containing protein [Nostoc sphaeroides]MCC5628615.1 peptidoglycan-binding protein [Nostoc sphaeroides CHAB 2801]
MNRFHLGFTDQEIVDKLKLQLMEKWQNKKIERFLSTSKNPQTNEYLILVETDSKEVENLLQNSGGRFLTNEEYEALTAYSKGDTGTDIHNIQQKLLDKNFYPYLPSGIFDEDTELAVKDFQRTNRLPVTGIVNEETMKKLRE